MALWALGSTSIAVTSDQPCEGPSLQKLISPVPMTCHATKACGRPHLWSKALSGFPPPKVEQLSRLDEQSEMVQAVRDKLGALRWFSTDSSSNPVVQNASSSKELERAGIPSYIIYIYIYISKGLV